MGLTGGPRHNGGGLRCVSRTRRPSSSGANLPIADTGRHTQRAGINGATAFRRWKSFGQDHHKRSDLYFKWATDRKPWRNQKADLLTKRKIIVSLYKPDVPSMTGGMTRPRDGVSSPNPQIRESILRIARTGRVSDSDLKELLAHVRHLHHEQI